MRYKITNKIIQIVREANWDSYLLELQGSEVEFDLDKAIKQELDGHLCIQMVTPLGEAWIPAEALAVVATDEEGKVIPQKKGGFADKMRKRKQQSRILNKIKEND